MGKRGPKPKPTALRRLEGNPSRRPFPANEAMPELAPPGAAPPAHLSAKAKAEWRKLYGPLRNCGLLTTADLSAFGVYCAAYGLWQEAQERLAKDGRIVTTPNGHKQASPWIAIARHEAELMKGLMDRFGMTPASRSRIAPAGTPPPPPEDEPEDDDPPPMGAGMGEFAGLIGKKPN